MAKRTRRHVDPGADQPQSSGECPGPGVDPRVESENLRFHLPHDFKLTPEDYDIAQMAWLKAMSVCAIIDSKGWKRDAKTITRVRRSLLKAVRWGVLRFENTRHEQLEVELRRKYPPLDSVNVEIDRTATLNRAAEIIYGEVDNFLNGPAEQFVCANAGGRTLADMVSLLQRLVPVPPKTRGKRIRFVSLNAAEDPDSFNHCSNYICVRLAEIFSAEHLAVVRPGGHKQDEDYKKALGQVDLVISSAGTTQGFFTTWLRQRDQSFPRGFVGDVAFHPLNEQCSELELATDVSDLLTNELRRFPESWGTVVKWFNTKKLLLVLTGDKLQVSRVLFEAGLARRCVLDSYLAGELCKSVASAAPSA